MAKDQLNSNHRGSNNLSSNHHCSKPVELKSPGLKTSWTQITMAQNQLNSNHHGSNKLSPNHNGSINLSSNHHSLKLWLKPGWAQEIFPLTINSAQNLYVQLSLPQLGFCSAQLGLARLSSFFEPARYSTTNKNGQHYRHNEWFRLFLNWRGGNFLDQVCSLFGK